MLKIRLKRVGRKHDPSYRLIVTESTRGPKSGKSIEILGNYDPRSNKSEIKIDRVNHWISVGAKVSDTAHNILITEKVYQGKKINVLPKKSPIVKGGSQEQMKEEKENKEVESKGEENNDEKDKGQVKEAEVTEEKDNEKEKEEVVEKESDTSKSEKTTEEETVK